MSITDVERLSIIFSTIVAAFVALGGAWAVRRKLAHEIENIKADTKADNANANRISADTVTASFEAYNNVFNLLQERDAQIVDLNRRMLELEARDAAYEEELKVERKRRVAAEAKNIELENEIMLLKNLVQSLTEQVNILRSQIPGSEPKGVITNGIRTV